MLSKIGKLLPAHLLVVADVLSSIAFEAGMCRVYT